MHGISRNLLRNTLIALIIALQLGLACYVIWNTTDQKPPPVEATVKPTQPVQTPQAAGMHESDDTQQPDDMHEMYKTILLNETRIDASEWKVTTDFFRYLLRRKKKNVEYFAPGNGVDDRIVDYIKGNPITHLMLMGTTVTGDCLPQIESMETLEWLEISNFKVLPSDLEKLVKLKHWKALRAYKCGLTDECLKILGTHKFEYLRINSNELITDAGTAYLKNEDHLITVALGGTAIRDRSCQILSQLPALENVELWNNSITDKSFPYFASMKKLRALNLRQTLITDKGVNDFNPPPSLKDFELTKCKDLSWRAIKNLRKRMEHSQVDDSDQ